jgi:molecular chaperone DnaJ
VVAPSIASQFVYAKLGQVLTGIKELGFLDVTEAALGADITVPTLDGKVKFTIHEGTQPGDEFKLKGKGIQRLNYSGKGDQYVKIVVEIPKNLSREQKDILKNFQSTSSEKNYKTQKSFMDKIKDFFD